MLGRGRPLIVHESVSEGMSRFFVEVCLRPDPVDYAQTFAKGLFQDVSVPAAGPGGSNPNSAHQMLVDRQRRLNLRHIAILPYRSP